MAQSDVLLRRLDDQYKGVVENQEAVNIEGIIVHKLVIHIPGYLNAKDQCHQHSELNWHRAQHNREPVKN